MIIKIKKYIYELFRKIIKYYLYNDLKLIYTRIDSVAIELINKEQNINRRIDLCDRNNILNLEWLNKLSKTSLSAFIDLWSIKHDTTIISIISRIWWTEKVDFFELRFSSIKELESYIKKIKRPFNSENIYIDKPHWFPFINI